MSVQKVRDMTKEISKLIEEWKISYARTTAQSTLTMVMSHHSEMEIWHVTKGIACRVAEMTNYATLFFGSVAVPPSPQEPEDSLTKAGSESEVQGDNIVDSSAPHSSSPPP